MDKHEELKVELASIAKIVNSFPDEVKSKVFDLLVSSYLGKQPELVLAKEEALADETQRGTSVRKSSRRNPKTKKPEQEPRSESTQPKKLSKKFGTKESWTIDRNLDLRESPTAPSFKDFVAGKQPKNESEFWTISTYYLQKLRGISPVTLNHIYTCYAEVRRKPPTAFRQTLINTKNRHGWIEPDDQGNVNIPHRGVVYVEHDLPANEKSKK